MTVAILTYLAMMPALMLLKKLYLLAGLFVLVLILFTVIDKPAKYLFINVVRFRKYCLSLLIVSIVGGLMHVYKIPLTLPFFLFFYSWIFIYFYQDLKFLDRKFFKKGGGDLD